MSQGISGGSGGSGAPGPPGPPGTDGNTWYSGAGDPGEGTGTLGDFYLDTLNSAWWGPKHEEEPGGGPPGVWVGSGPNSMIGETGAPGAPGAAGEDGNTWYSGSGAPSDATGVNGDFYLRTDTSAWYGPKAGGTWSGTGPNSLVGAQGPAGVTTRVATFCAVPATIGLSVADGLFYFRVDSDLSGLNLLSCGAALLTKSTSGTPTFRLSRGRQANPTSAHTFVSMLTTNITVDANEYDSSSAATPSAVNPSNDDVLTGDLIRVDCLVAGTGAAGLFITMRFG